MFKVVFIAVAVFLFAPIALYPIQMSSQDSPGNDECTSTPKKILISTIPKSGTHLLLKAVELITGAHVRWVSISAAQRINPYKYLHSQQLIIATHLFPSVDIVRTQYSNHFKKVLLVRDPRDVMVSFLHHILKKMNWTRCSQFEFEQFTKLSDDGKLRQILLYPPECNSPQECFKTALNWIHDPSVFVCRFEDLVGAQGGGSVRRQFSVLKSLAKFLEHPLSKEKINEIAEQLFGGTWTFRKGQIGSWKAYYNEDNKQLFKQLMGDVLIEMGYETDSHW